jgi:hypothetical protein
MLINMWLPFAPHTLDMAVLGDVASAALASLDTDTPLLVSSIHPRLNGMREDNQYVQKGKYGSEIS